MSQSASLPSNGSAWSDMVAEEGLKGHTIHSSRYGHSGSKMSLKQFLLLRVLWTSDQANEILNAPEFHEWEFDKYLRRARELLATLPEWTTYLSNCWMARKQLQTSGFASFGTFSLVRLYQLNTRRIESQTNIGAPKLDLTPIAMRTRSYTARDRGRPTTPDSPTPLPRAKQNSIADNAFGQPGEEEGDDLEASFEELSMSEHSAMSFRISPQSPLTRDAARSLQDINDEQVVNMALLAYLDALLIHFPVIHADWTPQRYSFVVQDQSMRKVYEARVDGFLRRRGGNEEIMAIVEVKPCVRAPPHDTAIRMQEGAQMAAWISQHPPQCKKQRGRKFRYAILDCVRENQNT